MLQRKRTTRADYSSSIDFSVFGGAADNLISDDVDTDEVISNIRIVADEYIGVVYFDYLDVRGGIQKAHSTGTLSVVKHDGRPCSHYEPSGRDPPRTGWAGNSLFSRFSIHCEISISTSACIELAANQSSTC